MASLLHSKLLAFIFHLFQNSEPPIEKLSLNNTPKSDHKTEYEAELERLETTLRTVQLALEILTGVCATLPDPGPEAAEEEGAEEDEDDGKCLHSLRVPVLNVNLKML